MKRLKNCPNCGGILDDEGRCMYCKSKVYDLTGMRIDLDTRDVVLLKFKSQGREIIYKAFPTEISVEHRLEPIYCASGFGSPYIMTAPPDIDLNLSFRATPYINENGDQVMYESRLAEE